MCTQFIQLSQQQYSTNYTRVNQKHMQVLL